MKRLLSFQPVSRPDPGPGTRIVGLDDQAAGDVFEALASDTTRDVLVALYDNPGTATEVAAEVGTTLQNAKYHLDKLRDADLIEVADTWYSEQGNEMKVYAPANDSVVTVAGDKSTRSALRETLTRLLGTFTLLAVGSFFVDAFVSGSRYTYQGAPRSSPAWTSVTDVGSVSPGILFFVGGLLVLSVVLLWSLR